MPNQSHQALGALLDLVRLSIWLFFVVRASCITWRD